MTGFLAKRLLGLLPVLFGISLVTFAVIHLAPGDPVSMQTEMNPKASLQARQKMVELYGLDRPIHVQYASWIRRLVRFDFGRSFKDREPAMSKIAARVPVTLAINALALLWILAFAIPIGVYGAAKPGSLFDHLTTVLVYAGLAVPTFWFALLLVSFFGVRLHWFPVSGLESLEHEYLSPLGKILDWASHLVLPLFVAVFTGLAGFSRYTRTGMRDALSRPYVRTAHSKGLSRARVFWGHAFRNAALPLVTLLGLSVPGLLGGSVIFESIFSIPGMGRLFFDSVYARDYPVIMGLLMIGALLTLVGNLLADLAYAAVDPRIRLDSKR